MDYLATAFDTKPLQFSNGIQKQKASEMKSNTEFHQLTWCPFSLHTTQIYPIAISTKVVDF